MQNNSDHSLDPRPLLVELATRASRYSVNLDESVSKDSVYCLRGGYATVTSGILQPREEELIEGAGPIKVAIKTPRGGFPGDVKTVKKFLKEVHAWSKLDHANVLPLIGITTLFELTVSIVSPWMEKGNARDHVRDKSVDPCPLIQGIASGLCYLHSRSPDPLYHGDVKGLNVLVTEEGRALLTDFGLSFLTNSSFSMSTSGHTGGSLPWMAPEMLEQDGEVYGEATAARDLWAFGMTALELFTREDPFYPLRGVGVMMRIMKGPPDRPSAENTCSRLTDEWWGICSECWHADPSKRPTMLQVAKKIEQILHRTAPNGLAHPNGLVNLSNRYDPMHGH
ncbi:hypothetical protein SCLCIDRAFT_1216116 [Scleroderma citrinum Foug A]|uniref:Protein kinase domain-containing protein n=1 Tax=Scleroderma citrinum Foug A TaxID=1036808 RepID=A0A0C3A8N6_9AGAM|nr:hypothetical protein SCLCIDRAFT_1216116 [Scleroderma citrinum Foug A]